MTRKTKVTAIITAVTVLLISANYSNNRNVITAEYNSAEFSAESKAEEKSYDIIVESTVPILTTTTTVQTTAKLTTQITTTTNSTETTQENDYIQEYDDSEWISIDEVTISLDMDISQTTGLSKDDFVVLMTNLPYDYYGYFERNAELIWVLCQEKSVNEIAACGIIAHESGWAKVHGWGNNNYFGIRGGSYSSEEEGLRAFINLLSDKYLSESGPYYKGKTLYSVGLTYCDGNVWPGKVYGCMKLIRWY